MLKAKPDILMHMAAQPPMRDTSEPPVEIYSNNAFETVHRFEAVLIYGSVKVVVDIATDECYVNQE